MTSTTLISKKIEQLTTKVAELKKQSAIDPLTASPDRLIENAQSQSLARENVVHLEMIIARLRSQLEIEGRRQSIEGRRVEAEKGFEGLLEQSDRVIAAIDKLRSEMDKLQSMGKQISSQHYSVTGKLALDNRIPQAFILPKVEKLKNSVIIHTETRNLIKQ